MLSISHLIYHWYHLRKLTRRIECYCFYKAFLNHGRVIKLFKMPVRRWFKKRNKTYAYQARFRTAEGKWITIETGYGGYIPESFVTVGYNSETQRTLTFDWNKMPPYYIGPVKQEENRKKER